MNEGERDQRVDAAWRATSREEPPPALDATIRAAARRAVDTPTAARRGKHWWYPLAAAATVALLAIGIAQLTPPERVAPTTVADMAAPPPATGNVSAPSAPALDGRREAPAAATPPPVTTPQAHAPTKPAASPQVLERARDTAGTAMQESSASAKAESSRQEQLAGAAGMADAKLAPQASTPAPAPPASASAPEPAASASAPSARPPSEPFPAAPAPAQPAGDAYLKPRTPAVDAAAGQAIPEQAQAQSRVATRKAAPVEAAKIADASALDVDEWIKRIRALKNAGRLDEVAKELERFRAAYGERADALLPAELREIKR